MPRMALGSPVIDRAISSSNGEEEEVFGKIIRKAFLFKASKV